MAAAWIHELRKQCSEEFPDLKYGDVFGKQRDRMVSAVKSANLGERAAKIGESARKVRLPEVPRAGEAAGPEAPTTEAPSAEAPSPEPPTTEAPTEVLGGEDQRLARLERLGELREKGILTEEEFAAEKSRILG